MSKFFTDGQLLQILNEAGLNPNKVRSKEVNESLVALVDTAVKWFVQNRNAEMFVPNDDYFGELGYVWDTYVHNHDIEEPVMVDINRDIFNTGMYHGVEQTYAKLGVVYPVESFRYVASSNRGALYDVLKRNISPAGLARSEGMEPITVYQDKESGKWWYRFDADFIDRMERQQ